MYTSLVFVAVFLEGGIVFRQGRSTRFFEKKEQQWETFVLIMDYLKIQPVLPGHR
jgi:hypothetical protein